MKILFFATSEFANDTLRAIHENKDFEIAGIVTQPDKPKGRGRRPAMPAVKVCAIDLGYEDIVFQPEKLKDNVDFFERIKKLQPDIGVVVSYGRLIPDELLDIPKYKLINIHPSLLPKYRGASPIAGAIMAGEFQTGVTIMKVIQELDAGDILFREKIDILDTDDCDSLSKKLAGIGAGLMIKTLYEYKNNGECKSFSQDKDNAGYTEKIEKQDCVIDWTRSCKEIFNFIRGLSSVPGAYTYYKNKILKIYRSEIIDADENFLDNDFKCGQIVDTIKNTGFVVKTGEGFLLITEVQPENGKRMSGQAFLCGAGQDCEGEILNFEN